MDDTRCAALRLTRDVRRSLETAEYLRVNVDAQVTIVEQLCIASFNKLRDPICKWFANESVRHVDDPLPRESLELVSLWQVLYHLWARQHFIENLFDAKALVLWH